MSTDKPLTRKQMLKKINDMFDDLEKHPRNSGKYKVFFIMENVAERPDIVALRQGWSSNQECRGLINSIFSLGNFSEPW